MLSVIIIVKNEADHLKRCLTSVQWADEIIVIDSGSTDNSVAVAKEFTDKVYIHADWQGYGIQKQRALEYASGTWVLNLDADESVNPDLKQAILEVIQHNAADAYRVPIHLTFYGKPLYYSWSPKRHVRLFKREGARYSDNIVHEAVQLPKEARIAQIKHAAIQHHSFQDVSHALYKMNVYSSYSADMRKKTRSPNFMKAVFGAWWMFIRCYFIQGGFLEGRDGFLLAVLSAEGSFYRGIKMIYPDKKELSQ